MHPCVPTSASSSIDTISLRRLWHPRRGTEILIREYLVPTVAQSYEDLARACEGADLLLTHGAAYAGPIVAKKLKLKWLSVALQPLLFLSAYDHPVLAPSPWVRHLGPGPMRVLLNLARMRTAIWARPIFELRKRLGIRDRSNPFFEGQFSPYGTLALFSKYYAQPQPDWPPNTHVCGFPFYDRRGAVTAGFDAGNYEFELSDLEWFLGVGPPPVLFTLGSSAVFEAGSFYVEGAAAAMRLGLRMVLLVGPNAAREFFNPVPDNVHVASYAPYSQIMPRCAAIVHQGGIGTTAQALRSGRPMLVVPWAHDQPDNAERVRRLGVSRTMSRATFTADRVTRALQTLLGDLSYAERASDLGEAIAAEDGVGAACNVIEAELEN